MTLEEEVAVLRAENARLRGELAAAQALIEQLRGELTPALLRLEELAETVQRKTPVKKREK